MKSIDIVSKIVAREGEAKASPSKGIQSINLSDYLLKSVWDKVFEIRTDSQGTEYIFGKLPMVTQYGITMYSGDGVDIPSLASGLPFDGRTIWYNPDTQQIEVIGGTGGGSGEGVSNFWDLSGIPSWITNSKPKYTYSEIEGTPDLTKYALVSQIPSLSGYATESWVLQKNYATKATTLSGYGITDAYTKTNVDELLKTYVTLGGTQTITGEKNFVGGLKVNGSPIVYDSTKKYWKLEGDLLVTGGVTMYGNEGTYTPSTIMDAIAVDGTTISKEGGVLKVIGGTGGGVADSVAWANITGKPTWIGSSKPTYSYSEITGAISTTELQNYLTSNSYLNVTGGDNRYLKLSGGTMTGNILLGGTTTNKIGTNIVDTSGGYQEFTHQNSHGYIAIGPFNDSVAHIYTDRPSFYFNKDLYVNNAKVWNASNDGSGSGLDADLLDGKQPSELNVASATKLQTARTIWGQSFDGTGNVSGVLTLPLSHQVQWADSGGAMIYAVSSKRIIIDGSVGIGTISPEYNLAVNGDSVTNNVRTNSVMFGYSDVSSNITSNRWYYASITYADEGKSPSYLNPALVFKTMNNTYQSGTEVERMRLCSNGNLSIGYAGNKGTKLYVEGSFLASGGITMYSDQRKKTILNHVELSLKDIANAPLIEHYYNNDDKKTTHVGSIAQYWASMNDWFCKLDSEGYYTMEIQNAALASAISIARELDRYETKTDKAIKKLKKRICELEEEIERLKSA